MTKEKFRCHCPITSTIDVIGDKWSLVIIKQMLIEEKKTFKDFIESDELIATNILSSRLKMLEEFNIIRKEKLPHNKKTNIYVLTKKGVDLAPVIIELGKWAFENLTEFNTKIIPDDKYEAVKADKDGLIKSIMDNYKENHWQ